MATAKSTSATSEDDTAADTAEFTVAPRRTVHIDGKDFGPGQTVSLDPTEGEYLRARGFFTEDDGTVAVSASGPAVNQEDGVRKDEA
ncbi:MULTISPECIES: hypothetical protein [Novosphingobium]|uniref:Multi-ubiquitin domain-containing protein n=1 Tax=Novosphingobium clariflavum TaxID=2029884 RepID=A0ABV6S1H3_9SPHN|nr:MULTISPECIES: hypothetical protein [Novosphingobium]QSR16065.1 hypothetical protein CA833_02440 [Novosphingobium sp. KA1]